MVGCRRCPRLRKYCELVGTRKRRAYSNWNYWKKPLPGFGDPSAELMVVGLAPAANGGTRTGRMFCGDSSGDWLIKALYETGFANQPTSTSRDDGLTLKGAYVTAVARCAPPGNKPTQREIQNCLPYLCDELRALTDLKVVLALGEIALKGLVRVFRREFDLSLEPAPRFTHGASYCLGGGRPKLYVSYHPSRRNTQTGLLTWPMWIDTFHTIRGELWKPDRVSRSAIGHSR